MKIEKIKKLNGGRYELLFSNNSTVVLFEDVIIKYNLFINKEFDSSLLSEITIDNICANYYNLALKYINIRLRTEKEIRDYLTRKQVNDDIINSIINKLIKQGYVDDNNFIKAFVNDKIVMTNWGPYKIIKELERLGINYEETIGEIMENDTIVNRIKNIINKQIAINKSNSTNMLKNKVSNYLMSLGYSKESIIEHISDIKVNNEEERYKKEYNKLYNKYKNKYSEYELKKVIKSKLYQKGYTEYEN